MFGIFKSEKRKIADAVLGIEQDKFKGRKLSKALLKIPPLSLRIEMGPYCNRSCSHCYGDYGPHRKEYMKPDMIKLVMEQIKDTHIQIIALSDGEPTHNKENLMQILDHINGFPTTIFTNGMFAETYESARDMLEEMKKHRFTISSPEQKIPGLYYYSKIAVSADRYHGEASYRWAVNLAKAFNDVFTENDVPAHSFIINNIQPNLTHPKDVDSDELNEKIVKPLEKIYSGLMKFRDGINKNSGYILGRKEGPLIPISVVGLSKIGRAEYLPDVSKRKLEEIDIRYSPTIESEIFLRHNGDIYAGGASCISSGRLLGNIKEKTLKEIIDGYMNNRVFQIHKVGGVELMLNILKEAGYEPIVRATDKCDVCKQVFADPKALEILKQ